MTSGTFTSFPLGAIIIRPDRQRRELRDIEGLAASIAARGLINPITLQRDGTLVAGERRYRACRLLGWSEAPAQYVDDLSEYELQCIELEENVKREALTWQEEADAIERLHELRSANEPDWTAERTAEEVGLSVRHVNRNLAVAKEMKTDEKVRTADKLSTAVNLVERSTQRRKANASAAIGGVFDSALVTPDDEVTGVDSTPAIKPVPLINTSFHTWQPTYDGPKFNLLHCDFPYGINVADSPRQNAALADHYEDGPDIYWSLLERLARSMDNCVAESAHLIFWFSMDYYTDTVTELRRMGWTVNPFPLIWHKSDNAGIAPDPQRWPRRTYETALVCSRGDRKLTSVGPRSNSFAFPGTRDGAIHISEKPTPVLAHFLSMFCDEYSIVLDPTAGSGNAMKVAEQLGAMSVLGLELSQEFYEVAVANWETAGD
jgi:ParB/RepB/Spo0J family partition protein